MDYDQERAAHAKEIEDLGKRLAHAMVALQEIATANTSDWCRPGPGLQGMAKEAISEIWKEEVIHAEEK